MFEQEKYRLVNPLRQTILGSMFTLDLYSIVARNCYKDDFYFESYPAFCTRYLWHGGARCCG